MGLNNQCEMLTVVDADTLEDELEIQPIKRTPEFAITGDPPWQNTSGQWERAARIRKRAKNGLLSVLTKKMGCLSANFSTPPLMMLVLKVMIPACMSILEYEAEKSVRDGLTISIAPQNDISP